MFNSLENYVSTNEAWASNKKLFFVLIQITKFKVFLPLLLEQQHKQWHTINESMWSVRTAAVTAACTHLPSSSRAAVLSSNCSLSKSLNMASQRNGGVAC